MKKYSTLFIKRFIVVLSVIGVIFVLVYLETLHRSYENYKIAEHYYKKGDYFNAVIWYQTALLFYTPLNPFFKKAGERLFEIARYYEKKGMYKEAIDTYGEIVHSIYGIRSFYTPYKDWQIKAKELISKCKKKLNQNS